MKNEAQAPREDTMRITSRRSVTPAVMLSRTTETSVPIMVWCTARHPVATVAAITVSMEARGGVEAAVVAGSVDQTTTLRWFMGKNTWLNVN